METMNHNTELSELQYEQFNHSMTRTAWDATIAERDELKLQVKIFKAIKKGLETSLQQAFDRISELENKISQ